MPHSHTHDGPCRLGLGFRFLGQPEQYNAAMLLREAVLWGAGLDDLASEVATADEILDRWNSTPRPAPGELPFAGLHLDVTPEEIEAVGELVRQALDYWDRNDYANTDGTDEDIWLGTCGPSLASSLRMCGIQMWGAKARRATAAEGI